MRRRRRFGRNFFPRLKEHIGNVEFFYVIVIVYLEILFKLVTFGNLNLRDVLITTLFSIPIAILCSIMTRLFVYNVNKICFAVITLFLILLFAAEFVYYKIYGSFFTAYSMSEGGQVLQFWREILKHIENNLFIIILFIIPLLVMFYIINKKGFNLDKRNLKSVIKEILSTFLILIICVLTINLANKGLNAYDKFYLESKSPIFMVKEFGLLTYIRVDLEKLIFNVEDEFKIPANPVFNDNYIEKDDNDDENICDYNEDGESRNDIYVNYNIMDIDFEELINNEKDDNVKKLHKYFSTISGTKKNEYTGMFKGKNLIMILAEGFSPMAVDPILTPSLYKVYSEGMKFNNFYTPLFPVSTSDGEYMFCTGLLPKDGVWSMYKSSEKYLPFVMGNLALDNGYIARAYHNHDYTYYGRDESHPNMGYNYVGVGNGLEDKIQTNIWPESDLEMIEATYADFINEDQNPFLTYYITVSGHLLYSFTGNMMAYKNKDFVKDINYSEGVKAYYACNIELDKAIEKLICELELAGIAEDTVIVMAADHYPYGLTLEEISEVQGENIDENFDIHKNNLIIWHKGIESEEIDKPCSSIDILPTLCNLFGFEYDSRMLVGKDIFSSEGGVVIFSNRSWLTEEGKYNSITGEFKENKKLTNKKEYIGYINEYVENAFSISSAIFDSDYYRRISN